jgi:hypothetical protein
MDDLILLPGGYKLLSDEERYKVMMEEYTAMIDYRLRQLTKNRKIINRELSNIVERIKAQ